MLRPKRMSRVSVTGTKAVMPDVIEAIHDLNLVHLVGYDGSWEGFEQGDPMERADQASEDLVTVRSIENILGIEEEERDSQRDVSSQDIDEELESVRQQVNDLDDRRGELRDRRRDLDERLDAAEPFVDLGIDFDLLSDYDSLTVRVGEGEENEVVDALSPLGAPFETFAGESTVAVFIGTAGDEVDEALVGVDFTRAEVPDASGPPEDYVAELEAEREEVETQLEEVEADLESLKLEAGQFILEVERELAITVQKTEAPLSFATTENAFIAEGWIPTERYGDLETALEQAAADHVEFEELERADYDRHGVAEHSETATDGGTDLAMAEVSPPVVQDNPSLTRPFELLVRTINRPSYAELDPTILVFLTFPTFFGFMIGDLGYGILYVLLGYLIISRFDSPGIKSLGGVGMWAGFFTIVFGILYGEVFGLHILGEFLWGDQGMLLQLGHPPIEKGLDATEFALLWLFVAMVLGVLHVGIGYVLDFINTMRHSVVDAVLESASWLLFMVGAWIWIFSRHLAEPKPAFLFTLLDQGEAAVFELGFAGFSPSVGLAALGVAAVGLVLMLLGEVKHEGGLGAIIGILETPNILVNVLSYARIPAVLLAKAGMAFVVNLLVFGLSHGHFALTEAPEEGIGLIHAGIGPALAGIVILVLGHAVVLALGITSAGLQAIRLEYVEFFQKFYEGGGERYEPFGYEGTGSPDA